MPASSIALCTALRFSLPALLLAAAVCAHANDKDGSFSAGVNIQLKNVD